MRQTAQPTQSPDPSPPITTPPHPRSSGRRQTPPPPRAVQQVQIPIGSRYTLFASGLPLALRQTVVATRFSQIQRPDAPSLCEISGLGGPSKTAWPGAGLGAVWAYSCARRPPPRSESLPQLASSKFT